ncbi:DNA polymerase-3 subunit beta [Paenibacillus favisporus]|uniref:Beta sliding clamp n=2 Tax=Paenibacillus favisporus TaxID=221028 RepID=A0ABV2F8P8_9BACL
MVIQAKLPLDEGHYQTGSIAVPSRLFADMIRKLPAGVVTLETQPPFLLKISSGSTVFRLYGMDPEDSCSVPDLGNHLLDVELSSSQFKKMVQQVVFASARSNEPRPVLTGTLFHIANGSMKLMATDCVRLASCTILLNRNLSNEVEAIIPSAYLKHVSKLLSGEKLRISFSNHRMVIQNQDLAAYIPLITGSFPPMETMTNATYVTEVRVSSAAFLSAIERVNLVAGGQTVLLNGTPHSLELSSNTPEVGDVHETTPVQDFRGEPFRIAFNGKYMQDIIRVIDSEWISIQYASPLKPLIVTTASTNESLVYLITPLRTRNT